MAGSGQELNDVPAFSAAAGRGKCKGFGNDISNPGASVLVGPSAILQRTTQGPDQDARWRWSFGPSRRRFRRQSTVRQPGLVDFS